MHFQRRKFNSLSQLYNTFTREIPNTENNFYPISLSNHLNPSPTIYLFPVISLNPEIGIRFLSPYFFPARRGEEILGQKARIPGEPKAPQTQESAPLLVGEGKRIKTFIRAFKGSWSTGPEGAPWLCRKEDSWNDRTLTSGRFVWACRGGACRDKSRIFISFLSLSLSPHWPPFEGSFPDCRLVGHVFHSFCLAFRIYIYLPLFLFSFRFLILSVLRRGG